MPAGAFFTALPAASFAPLPPVRSYQEGEYRHANLFTSESVTEGHPDKVCDQISDAVLDALLARDPMARGRACETCATTGLVQVMGEITTTAYVAIDEIARQVLRDIGYVDASLGFSADGCAVLTAVHAQSPDIAMGVDHALETREPARAAPAQAIRA